MIVEYPYNCEVWTYRSKLRSKIQIQIQTQHQHLYIYFGVKCKIHNRHVHISLGVMCLTPALQHLFSLGVICLTVSLQKLLPSGVVEAEISALSLYDLSSPLMTWSAIKPEIISKRINIVPILRWLAVIWNAFFLRNVLYKFILITIFFCLEFEMLFFLGMFYINLY